MSLPSRSSLATSSWRRVRRWCGTRNIRMAKEHGAAVRYKLQIPAINPLQIPTAITFAVIFVVISVITESMRTAFGQTGVLVLAGS